MRIFSFSRRNDGVRGREQFENMMMYLFVANIDMKFDIKLDKNCFEMKKSHLGIFLVFF